MSPEQLLALKMPKKEYFKIDVWALGISIIEIIMCKDVFELEGFYENIKRIEEINTIESGNYSMNPKRLV